MSEPQFLALGKGAMTISAHQGGREVSPGTGLGKRVSDGVTLILVLGFELLQPSRLPSHGADEETETQTIERSCLEATGAEPKYTDPPVRCTLFSSVPTFLLAAWVWLC